MSFDAGILTGFFLREKDRQMSKISVGKKYKELGRKNLEVMIVSVAVFFTMIDLLFTFNHLAS
ncbi:hypothetical protein IGI39_003743 [Enterococcus sp. AZ135]